MVHTAHCGYVGVPAASARTVSNSKNPVYSRSRIFNCRIPSRLTVANREAEIEGRIIPD